MITFPCAKINLGLNIVGVRPNGYHDIETVFYPIPLHDALEVQTMHPDFPTDTPCDIKITGNSLEGHETDNLVLKAYRLLANDFELPRLHVHLHKHIPSQAGMGGGSADAACMIRLLNEQFNLRMSVETMQKYASQLGADCAFFIHPTPSYATGIGEILSATTIFNNQLEGYYLAIVKPDVAVSTKEAYQEIEIAAPQKCCNDIVAQPIDTWKHELTNDFETPVFRKHPILKDIKTQLYLEGAAYASMSGSGSAMYGIFKQRPNHINSLFKDCFTDVLTLSATPGFSSNSRP